MPQHSLVEAEAEKLRTLLSTAVQRSHQLIDQMNQTERRLGMSYNLKSKRII